MDTQPTNTSGTVTETRDERIVRSDVTRFGSRTVDTGQFWFNGRTCFAHRIAYELYVGEIPEGISVLHK